MGGKFESLNIQGVAADLIQSLAPECVVREIAAGWITVAHEMDDFEFEWGVISTIVQRLSNR